MSDTDSLTFYIEDGKGFNNQGTDELFYTCDAEEKLDQFVVTPDLGSVIDSTGLCREIAQKLSTIAGEAGIFHPGQLQLLLQAQNYMTPETSLHSLERLDKGRAR